MIPDPTRKAVRFITNECVSESPGFVSRVVLCELVWVLESAYGDPREKVQPALGKILRTSRFGGDRTLAIDRRAGRRPGFATL